MIKKSVIHERVIHIIWIGLLFLLVILIMSILKCEMATPAY